MPFDQQNFEPTPSETDWSLQILATARSLIQSGWSKCVHQTDDGRFCIQGALAAAGSYAGPPREMLIEAMPVADRHPIHRNISLMLWNDNSNTTHADVLALFDRAIAARKAELLAEKVA